MRPESIDWMILLPPCSFVFAGMSGFCGSLENAVRIPVPLLALALVLLELELLLLLEQAVSSKAAAATATRPRALPVETVILRLLKISGLT
jgi:hypothetical protein